MPEQEPSIAGPQRFITGVFGGIFCVAGLSVIGFLWMGFDEAPLFFRFFGSLISLGCIAMGGTFVFMAFKGQPLRRRTFARQPSTASSGTGYPCPACGARLGEDADVSPKGDVRCGYCRKWFNIHGA